MTRKCFELRDAHLFDERRSRLRIKIRIKKKGKTKAGNPSPTYGKNDLPTGSMISRPKFPAHLTPAVAEPMAGRPALSPRAEREKRANALVRVQRQRRQCGSLQG